MKYDLSICAPIGIAALLLLAMDTEAARPNNYINIDNNGVVAELEQGGDAYLASVAGTTDITYRDMATQAELDAAVTRLDAEDMRLHGGEVVGDELVLTVGDFAKSRGRNEVYTKEVTIDVSSLRGNDGVDGTDGADGTDGRDGRNGTDGLDGLNGTDGTDGRDGRNGTDGLDGLDGADGADGADGRDGRDGIDGLDGRDGLDVPKTVQLDLRAGIAGALAATHAIRADDGMRLGFGVYHGEGAVAIGGRSDDVTFTFTIDTRGKASVGFGLDL